MCCVSNITWCGSDNCPRLNVCMKNLPSYETCELKPVIAFYHSRVFAAGSVMNHGPEYLIDILLVTIQYRVGFMTLETPDQNLALK